MINQPDSPIDGMVVHHSPTDTTTAPPVVEESALTLDQSSKHHDGEHPDYDGSEGLEIQSDRSIRPGHSTVHFAGDADSTELGGSNSANTDPVPAYQSPTDTMEGDEKPRYVSRDMNEAWERAQTSQEEEKSERDRKRSRARLHTVIYAISTLIGMGINIAIAYGAYTVIGGFNTISFTDDEGSTTEAITDLASRLTEPTTELEEDSFKSADEYFYMSQSSLIKAAVLAGVLSTVPALVIALIAYTTQRELDQLRHECEYDCDDVV